MSGWGGWADRLVGWVVRIGWWWYVLAAVCVGVAIAIAIALTFRISTLRTLVVVVGGGRAVGEPWVSGLVGE